MKGDVISGVIVVAIIVGSTILVLNTLNPFIEEGQGFQSFNEAKQTLTAIDSVITQLFYEAPGARRSLDVNVREGKLIVTGPESSIKIRLENLNLFPSGLVTQEGNIRITSGSTMRAYEADIDGDSNTDLVLENGVLLFAIKKLGTPTSHVVVNTTTMITMMKNKVLNVNATPVSGIFVNDKDATSYGVGYTELTKLGDTLTSSSIHVFVNATAGDAEYDVLFTLGASQDFVDMQVTHVVGG
jgi:hypothetical protein